jgi:hypothetical protein
MFDCPARIKTFTGPLNFSCGLPAPACWAIAALAANDMAITAPTILPVLIVFILLWY